MAKGSGYIKKYIVITQYFGNEFFLKPCDTLYIATNRTLTTNNQQRKVETIAVTHPVSSRFDLFDPRRDVLWRSGPGSVSGTRTCCSSDRACACWLPVGWLGRPWQPVSVWWECWQELPFSPPSHLWEGGLFFPSSPLLVCLLCLFKIKIRISKKERKRTTAWQKIPHRGDPGVSGLSAESLVWDFPSRQTGKDSSSPAVPCPNVRSRNQMTTELAEKCYSPKSSDGTLTLVPTHVSHQDYTAKELNLNNSSEERLN